MKRSFQPALGQKEVRAMDDKIGTHDLRSWISLFQPDVIAPIQYLEKWRCRRCQNPESLLMFAVLEDAVTCFQQFSSASSRRGKAIFREAENWLLHEQGDWLFSFNNICDVLGLSPNYLRAGLVRWRVTARTPQPKFRLFYVVRNGRRARRAGGFSRMKSSANA